MLKVENFCACVLIILVNVLVFVYRAPLLCWIAGVVTSTSSAILYINYETWRLRRFQGVKK